MENYRLKKEAVKFFKECHATRIYPLDTWKKMEVDMNALEKVEDCHLCYGRKMGDTGATLNGWSQEKGGRI